MGATLDRRAFLQAAAFGVVAAGGGWGLGMSVATKKTESFNNAGRFGWDGGFGTSAYSDPVEDLTGVLFTQRTMDSPVPPKIFNDFWTQAYAAIGS